MYQKSMRMMKSSSWLSQVSSLVPMSEADAQTKANVQSAGLCCRSPRFQDTSIEDARNLNRARRVRATRNLTGSAFSLGRGVQRPRSRLRCWYALTLQNRVHADKEAELQPDLTIGPEGLAHGKLLGWSQADMQKYDLSTSGDRPALETRFQQWTVMYNANMDSSHPASLSKLRADLERAETSRRKDKERGKDDEVEALQTSDGLKKYAAEHKSDFERLRQDILERKRRKSQGGLKDSPIEVE